MTQLTLLQTARDHVTLVRMVKGKMRYYLLAIDYSLLGDFILEKIYGGIGNSKPTRVLREFYSSWIEAKERLEIVAHAKKKKGYSPIPCDNNRISNTPTPLPLIL